MLPLRAGAAEIEADQQANVSAPARRTPTILEYTAELSRYEEEARAIQATQASQLRTTYFMAYFVPSGGGIQLYRAPLVHDTEGSVLKYVVADLHGVYSDTGFKGFGFEFFELQACMPFMQHCIGAGLSPLGFQLSEATNHDAVSRRTSTIYGIGRMRLFYRFELDQFALEVGASSPALWFRLDEVRLTRDSLVPVAASDGSPKLNGGPIPMLFHVGLGY